MSVASPDESSRVPTGYAHARYALSHREFGRPLELPRCGGWVIVRPIPGFAAVDAMGSYPLFCCQDWSRLHMDVTDLGDELVSLTMVADPFGDYDEAMLRECFPDRCLPFKEHYVIDVENLQVSRTHRKCIRTAARENVIVETTPYSPAFLEEWMELYGNLKARRAIKGIQAFSRDAFEIQLTTPGMVILRATIDGQPVAASTYYVQGDVAQGHIWGANERGYKNYAMYAMLGFAIEYFNGTVRWINLQGLPGAKDGGSEGVAHFKRGWTPVTKTAWLCGRILDRQRYAEISRVTRTSEVNYFPAYRNAEMTGDEEKPAASGAGSSEPSARV
jgi:hypothetical protein